jgi:hypothetical protein
LTTTPPLVVIVGVAGALVVAALLVVALVLSGHSADLTNTSVVLVLGFCSTVILTLLGIGVLHSAVQGIQGQVVEVHQQVNSRLDQLVKASSEAAHAAGVVQGQTAANAAPGPIGPATSPGGAS